MVLMRPRSASSDWLLQRYMGIILGPVLILVGMLLLGMLNLTGSVSHVYAGQGPAIDAALRAG